MNNVNKSTKKIIIAYAYLVCKEAHRAVDVGIARRPREQLLHPIIF